MTSPALIAPQGSEVVVSRKSALVILDRIIFYGVFGLLLSGPLVFGAVDNWAIFLLELGTVVLFVLWVARQWISSDLKLTQNPLFVPMLAFAGLIALQWAGGRSAYRELTRAAALLYCAQGMLCFLSAQCLTRASQAKKLALIFSVYGSAVAFLALLQGIAPNGKIYWMREAQAGGWIYGPYVNHNHYAGLMEMLVPIPLVFCFSRYAYGTRKTLAAAASALMASTVFLSGSRGGMLALMLEILVFAVIVIAREKSLKAAFTIGTILLLLTGFLTWAGGGEVTKRLASIHNETRTELAGGVRLSITQDGLRMWLKRPILGWGLGTFPVIYPGFRSFYTDFFVNAAHNDYLQLLVETGALGFSIMLWFLVVLFRSSRKKLRDCGSSINGTVTLGAALGCVGILLHSFLDFNLQIPANAALFYVLCVIAASEPLVESSRRRRSHVAEEAGTPLSPATVTT